MRYLFEELSCGSDKRGAEGGACDRPGEVHEVRYVLGEVSVYSYYEGVDVSAGAMVLAAVKSKY